MPAATHTPVLPTQVVAALSPGPGQTYLDCTAGLGGHAALMAPLLGPTGAVILNDHDPENLAAAAARINALSNPPRVVTIHGNFADAPRRLVELGLSADMVLADLGFASNQVETAQRGFSFQREGPLDMRLDPTSGRPTAAHLVNTLPEAELGEILRDLGEERAWRLVAAKLVAARKSGPILTTGQLAEIVRSCVRPSPGSGIDPATRTFQALRIAVNDELGSLRSLLESVSRTAGRLGLAGASGMPGGSWLRAGARVAIISFHSLEDRPVKDVFGELVSRGRAEHVSRKPIEAEDAELAINPRSRSAKLRAIRIL